MLPRQRPHVAGAEGLAHLPARLVHVEDAVALGGRDAGRVLAAVLQQQQGVVDLLVDRPTADHPDDSAHGVLLRSRLAAAGRLAVAADEAHGAAVDALGALLEFARRARRRCGRRRPATPRCRRARERMPRPPPSRRRRRRGTRCRGSRCPRSPRGRGRRGRRARGTPGGGDQVERSTSTHVPCGRTRARLAAMPPPVTWLRACTPSPVSAMRRRSGGVYRRVGSSSASPHVVPKSAAFVAVLDAGAGDDVAHERVAVGVQAARARARARRRRRGRGRRRGCASASTTPVAAPATS